MNAALRIYSSETPNMERLHVVWSELCCTERLSKSCIPCRLYARGIKTVIVVHVIDFTIWFQTNMLMFNKSKIPYNQSPVDPKISPCCRSLSWQPFAPIQHNLRFHTPCCASWLSKPQTDIEGHMLRPWRLEAGCHLTNAQNPISHVI